MSKFLSYILNLRGIAILIVVGVHARANVDDWASNPDVLHYISTFFEAREGSGTVMFLFIGGFLFQYITHNNFDFKKYIEKKFLYVIIPYVLISIPIIAYRIYSGYSHGLPPGFNEHSVFFRFFYYIFTGLHLAPFWFISAIVLFYLTAPVFHLLDNAKAYRFVFPVLMLISLFTFRSHMNANPLLSYVHFMPVYYLGMWASFHRNTIMSYSNRLIIPLACLYIGLSIANLFGYLGIPERITFEEVYNNGWLIFNMDLFKAIILCFLMMFILYRFQEKRFLFFEILGEYSFGIFFVHCLFIYGTKNLWTSLIGPIDFSLAGFIIYFAFILFISTMTVYAVKKLTGRYSRILIGS